MARVHADWIIHDGIRVGISIRFRQDMAVLAPALFGSLSVCTRTRHNTAVQTRKHGICHRAKSTSEFTAWGSQAAGAEAATAV